MLFITSLTLLTMFILGEFTLAGASDVESSSSLDVSLDGNGVLFSTSFANVSGSYSIPELGFNISLPAGWSGLDLKSLVMVSPTGINPKTGVLNPSDDQDEVYLIIARSKVPEIMGMTDHNVSNYELYVGKTAESIGCKVLSDRFVKLNGMNVEKLLQRCGPPVEGKSIAYTLSSGKYIIFVGLKGTTLAFDHNLEKFNEAVLTIKIDNQTNIKSTLKLK
jgi:hypothetical protein